jgi:hypothetical protein
MTHEATHATDATLAPQATTTGVDTAYTLCLETN